jgi:hypothetical protein
MIENCLHGRSAPRNTQEHYSPYRKIAGFDFNLVQYRKSRLQRLEFWKSNIRRLG